MVSLSKGGSGRGEQAKELKLVLWFPCWHNAGARDREQREHLSPRRYAWLVVKSSLGLRVDAKHHPSRLWALVVLRVVGAGGRRWRRGRATVTCSL